ncbi:type II toxin-antitoxin system Phd/YefM family antitoxin [Paracandidimonas soli]|jgi:antitoxin YefM|uniref:Antitoxin n=1 Tax=Paracandidimonas soli TaxID=1917182 RepID=A0A4R3V6N7_9BURK|nr:type II toxin-antitoxin system prevent-host-death family antitoxin [Paracandidimonas soli]TCV00676.1 antitoxin YefM [Paracandidimonas soli]
MNVLTFSEARAGLKQVMDDVCADHEPAVITRLRGDHVVILSLADYNSMSETLHLLSSQKNARRLQESIQQLNAGRIASRNLVTDAAETKEQIGSEARADMLD